MTCEALEGRRLLNGSWQARWAGPAGRCRRHTSVTTTPALERARQHMGGDHAINPTLQADLKTLQTDFKTLQSEVPSSVTTQLAADRTTIEKAISSLTPAERHTLGALAHMINPGTDPTAGFTATLQAANVPTSQINSIVADFQNYKTTLQTIDPTLTAKIPPTKRPHQRTSRRHARHAAVRRS